MRALLVVAALAAPAAAERYVVQPGETLEHVADHFGCSTDEVLRANHLNNTLVPARTVIDVPACTKQSRVRKREVAARTSRRSADPEDRKAQRALDVIDGKDPDLVEVVPVREPAVPSDPLHGQLRDGRQLPRDEGYYVRNPDHAFGTPTMIAYIRAAIGEVRALVPDVHVLAIGDISAKHGGKLADHLSHRQGVDIDIGFYFTKQPKGYPQTFVDANKELDLAATWALLVALARSMDRPDGVAMMFLDYDVQARFVAWAAKQGTPKADLEALFQYPRGKDAMVGLIRHWPNHANHVHVRFRQP